MISHIEEVVRGQFNIPLTATIGSFDGVHIAHRKIIDQLIKRANESNTESALITFEPHPRLLIEGENSSLKILTTLREKEQILAEIGVKHLIVLKFDNFFRSLTAKEFTNSILKERLNVKNLLVGYDNNIGCDRQCTAEFISKQQGIDCVMIDKISCSDNKISSTMVRKSISNGDIELANQLLASPYRIISKIDEHSKIIIDNPYKLIPPEGIYVCNFDNISTTLTVKDNSVIKINQILPDCIDYNSYHKIELINQLK